MRRKAITPLSVAALTVVCVLGLLIACSSCHDDHASSPLANDRNKRVMLEPITTHAHVPELPPNWRLAKSSAQLQNDVVVPLIFALTRATSFNIIAARVQAVSEPSSPEYGNYANSREEVAQFAASSADTAAAVLDWVSSFSPVSYSFTTHRDYLMASVPLRNAEEMLACRFNEYVHLSSSRRMLRCASPYSVPHFIAPHLVLIAGVNRLPNVPSMKEGVAKAVEAASVVTPSSIRALYNISVSDAPVQNLQAVVSFLGQYYSPSDLSKFQAQFGTPITPIEKTLGPNIPTQPGVEAELDVQYLTGVTGAGLGARGKNIRTWVYSTPGNRSHDDEPFLNWLATIVNSDAIPYVFSISYQDYEYYVNQRYAQRVSEDFALLSMRGRTLVTGSGDWGVGCQSDFNTCTKFVADFPSSSPYIVSTGAVYVATDGSQQGVSFSSGGFSYYFPQQPYQSVHVSQYLKQPNIPPTSFFNPLGRAFPDVAAVGVNFQVIYNNTVIPVAGTSASTPTFAAMISLINNIRIKNNKPTLGLVLPFIYKAASAFNDVTQCMEQAKGCCSRSFPCTQGWDPYTGLGTPDWYKLSQFAMDSSLFPTLV